jgi:hypothetical protein
MTPSFAINAFWLSDTQPTKGEYTVLTALSARFSKVAGRFADQINELKEKRARWAREEGIRSSIAGVRR